jgi:hypothetical protein
MPTPKLKEALKEAKVRHGLSYTFHYYYNVDISSPNPNYLNYLKSDIKLIG